jgi:RimJ/RimL family protein N-acetyltransferase
MSNRATNLRAGTEPSLLSIAAKSRRLSLKPLQLIDAEAVRLITDDPAITDAISFMSSPFTLADAENLIRMHASGRDCFAGLWLAEGRLAGVAGAHLQGVDKIEVGYWIASNHQRQGYATEALAASIGALRLLFPNRRVIAECRPENSGSVKVLQKIGFEAVGARGHRPGRMQFFLPKRADP